MEVLAGSAKIWQEKLRRVVCRFNGFEDQAKKVEIWLLPRPQEEEAAARSLSSNLFWRMCRGGWNMARRVEYGLGRKVEIEFQMVDRGWRFLAGSAKVWREKLRRVECGFSGPGNEGGIWT